MKEMLPTAIDTITNTHIVRVFIPLEHEPLLKTTSEGRKSEREDTLRIERRERRTLSAAVTVPL